VSTTNDTIDRYVRSLASVDDDELRGAERTPEARQLLAQILETPPAGEVLPGPARRRNRRPRRRAAPLVALAAAVAVAAAMIVGPGGDGASPAVAALRDAAAVAARQAPVVPAPGEFLYQRTEVGALTVTVAGGSSYAALVPRVRETWIGAGGAGWVRQSGGEPAFLTPADRRRWVEAGRPSIAEPAWSGRLAPAPASALPTDPDSLYRRLEREAAAHSEGTHEEMFTLVGDALRGTRASAAQRSALYVVAARIPGVLLLGERTDAAGRTGVAVAMDNEADGERHVLIFDPATAALLAEEQRAISRRFHDVAAGTLLGYATYGSPAVVDALRQRPAR
jgi:hypothetical protein